MPEGLSQTDYLTNTSPSTHPLSCNIGIPAEFSPCPAINQFVENRSDGTYLLGILLLIWTLSHVSQYKNKQGCVLRKPKNVELTNQRRLNKTPGETVGEIDMTQETPTEIWDYLNS